MFSLIWVWTNGWVYDRDDAGDLRGHRAHYDVTVMDFHSYQLGYLLDIVIAFDIK